MRKKKVFNVMKTITFIYTYTAEIRKMWNNKTFLKLKSAVNMKHCYCAVYTDLFHFKGGYLTSDRNICFITTSNTHGA